ncbi:hypothetical protein [Dyella lutea]|uniref:Vitamin B12 transport system permease protein n=1 Tax=Dyella lutea TaxID=2950441 RepID=A0ABT1FA13_9GAMM|nr:hypothetical protein [Dyella lutea]MCP1374215.1 hypothetical protein [Dyella lutea]
MKRLYRFLSLALSLISAAMLGLAAGALWMLVAAYLQSHAAWLAIPVGTLLGWAIARWISPRRKAAPWLAAAATLLAAVYVNVLITGLQLAGSLGMGLTEAVRTAGPAMLWALGGLGARPAHWIWFAAGAAVAALAARRISRPAS